MNDLALEGYDVGLPDQAEQHYSHEEQGQRKCKRELRL